MKNKCNAEVWHGEKRGLAPCKNNSKYTIRHNDTKSELRVCGVHYRCYIASGYWRRVQ